MRILLRTAPVSAATAAWTRGDGEVITSDAICVVWLRYWIKACLGRLTYCARAEQGLEWECDEGWRTPITDWPSVTSVTALPIWTTTPLTTVPTPIIFPSLAAALEWYICGKELLMHLTSKEESAAADTLRRTSSGATDGTALCIKGNMSK
mgnify:CR=1 FL=1